jgi:acid phosphatase
VTAAALLVICACSTPTASAPTSTVPAADTAAGRPTKVLVVVEENHSAATALAEMPYLAGLADQYGQTSDYRAITHPSLPNYLAIAGGSTFGVTDDKAPASHPITQPSVFDEALAAGRSAGTYAEAMPQACALTADGRYAVKHNPWAYFSAPASRTNCQRFDVPAGTPEQGALHDDVLAGALPTIGMLIPDLCNDGHDCSLQVADDWLHQWLPFIMAGPDYRAGQLAIVVTFDEDDRTAGNTVLTTVIAPAVSKVVASTPLDHYSLSRYLAELAAVPPPGEAAGSTSLAKAFTL